MSAPIVFPKPCYVRAIAQMDVEQGQSADAELVSIVETINDRRILTSSKEKELTLCGRAARRHQYDHRSPL